MHPTGRETRRDLAFDLAAVLGAAAVTLAAVLGPGSELRGHGGLTLTVGLALAAALWWRRRAPVAILWLNVGVSMLLAALLVTAPGALLEGGTYAPIPPTVPFAVYAALVHGTRGRTTWPPVAALAVVTGVAVVPWDYSPIRVRTGVIVLVVPVLLGLYVGARRRLHRSLLERAEHERHVLAEQARAEERARLAAEMHDVVGHQVSLIVLQAGAMSVTAPDEATREAAESLRERGGLALDELRGLITVLRDGPCEPAASEPEAQHLPDLAPLLAGSESGGVPVRLIESGESAGFSPAIARAAYRVVQEALTNVRKHAPGARAAVEVRHRADGVDITVANTRSEAPAESALRGSGTGLIGLHDRVHLVGGTFRARPTDDGGFLVEARFPGEVGR